MIVTVEQDKLTWLHYHGKTWETMGIDQWKDAVIDYYKAQDTEGVILKDINSNKTTKTLSEQIKANEVLTPQSVFYRKFTEKSTLKDADRITRIFKFTERVGLNDTLLRYLEYILSDMMVLNAYYDLINFNTLKEKPFSYTDFQKFIVGEYEYKEAKVKMYINSAFNAGRLYVPRWIFNVDIPDLVDKGTSTFNPLEGDDFQYVEFQVKFYYLPEVTANVIGGSNIFAKPEIANSDGKEMTTEGFWYRVIDNSGSPVLNSKISWNAIGGTIDGKDSGD